MAYVESGGSEQKSKPPQSYPDYVSVANRARFSRDLSSLCILNSDLCVFMLVLYVLVVVDILLDLPFLFILDQYGE